VIAGWSVVARGRAEEDPVPPQKCFGFVQTFDQMLLSWVPAGDGSALAPATEEPIVTVEGCGKQIYRLSLNSHYSAVNFGGIK